MSRAPSRAFEVTERVRGVDGSLVARVRVPRDLDYFRGHFDTQQILPAVAQLGGLVLDLARDTWTDLAPLRHVRRLKFQRPVPPDAIVTVTLARRADSGDLRFTIALHPEGLVAASGVLTFGPRE